MTEAIDIKGLTKTFGRTTALNGLDLTVRRGDVHAFLGPNGAGKTTTIRILLGMLRADAGEVKLLGGDPWSEATELHKRLAYVPGDVTLWPSLSGGEVIDLLMDTSGRKANNTRRNELIERFDLDPRKKVRTYSKGNRQKVALIAALATDTELLLLDEPTSGLDPLMENTFREVIQQEQSNGDRTVLLSSHILSEVEALSDRVTIVRDGRTVDTGTLADLRALTRTTVKAELTSPATGLETLEGVHNVRTENGVTTFDVDKDGLSAAMAYLGERGVSSVTSQPPTLEELFLRHYDRSPVGAHR
ncbi:ABC transporter ATP-binding protein [Tenggerimyces flavus]|uniref:ATP-binding cassette domain-containing protein n=1 Tax=Tenggerimyces flavus TaxID=1708749 RepID=A0ABV7YJ42_9ACTN|nr:ABC transporter ATP-binding protein [Tenggerimyces flavus]MBM7784699.1 ABC-2 type transport system ATP-binding protein [Tenggerimyces flavus]